MDVAEYAIVKGKNNTIEEAIDFLNKGDDGLYNHDFVESQGLICYLCHEEEILHRKNRMNDSFREEMKQIDNQNIENMANNLDIPNIMKEKSYSLA